MEKKESLIDTDGIFLHLYERNINCIYRICFLYLKNKDNAEDAVQTVFYKYLKKPKSFNDAEHEKAWFIKTAQNTCRDYLRSFWHSRKVDLSTVNNIQLTEEKTDDTILEKLLELPGKYSSVLYLYYYEEYSVKEISEILKRNPSTVRTQLSIGRQKLKINIGGYYER